MKAEVIIETHHITDTVRYALISINTTNLSKKKAKKKIKNFIKKSMICKSLKDLGMPFDVVGV